MGSLIISPKAKKLITPAWWWVAANDGAVNQSGGTQALSTSRAHTNVTLSSGAILSMASYRLVVTGQLTLTGNSRLHNDGGSATGATGGTGVGQGHLAISSASNAPTGSGVSGAGTAGAAVNPGLGGNGGNGGSGSDGDAGGAGGVVTLPTGANFFWWGQALEMLAGWNGSGWQRFQGGAPGGGGAGSNLGDNRPGGGAGAGGGLGWVAAKKIVIESGSRISCRGGDGAANGVGAGVGGPGGGGLLLVFCDEFEGTYSWIDCLAGAQATPGAGGGSSTAGSPGRVALFIGTELAYASGF